MQIKNYTTSVDAQKSIMQAERILVEFGSEKIMKEYYLDGRVRSLSFILNNKPYKLPINDEGMLRAIFKRPKTDKKSVDRAYRVCWRVLKDWLHAQLSLIAAQQAQPDEVLLPYLWDGKQTLYKAYKDGNLKLEFKNAEGRT